MQVERQLLLGPTDDRECWVWARNTVFPGTMAIQFDAVFLASGSVPEVGRHGGVAFCGTVPTERTDPSFSGYEVDWIDREFDRGLRLVRADGGALTTLAVGNPHSQRDPPLRWRVEVLPDRIRVFGDRTLYIDHADATYRGGAIGFWAWAFRQELAIDNVLLENAPLAAAFSVAPMQPVVGAPLDFDGSFSTAPLGVGVRDWSWSLGDGAALAGPSVRHVYTAAGDYPVTLTVTDGLRRTAFATQIVHVDLSLAAFADCFDFEEGPPSSWSIAAGEWLVSEGKLRVATDQSRTDEAWAWAGSPARPIAGDFTVDLELTAGFDTAFAGQRGVAAPFAGLALVAGAPAASINEETTGYLIGWTVPRPGVDPVLILSFLRATSRGLAFADRTFFFDQEAFARWRIEVTADAITLSSQGQEILRVLDRRFRNGFVGLHARNGGSLVIDDFAVSPQAPPCQLVLAAEAPPLDPPVLRLQGTGVPAGESCPERSDCGCEQVQITLDGLDLGVFPAGNPFELDLPLPAGCTPGSRRSVVVRAVSGGVLGPAAAANFTCPALPPRGRRIPGDCNSDAAVDLADAVCLLLYLFVGDRLLPCDDPRLGMGTQTEASRRAVDFDGDAFISITDPIALLNYLFLAGPPPALGERCTPIAGCPVNGQCR